MQCQLDRAVTDAVNARGLTGLWELAAATAIWPYIAGPLLRPGTALDVVSSPYSAAISLAATLLLLVGLRYALNAVYASNVGALAKIADIDPASTLPTAPRADRHPVTGLPTHLALAQLAERAHSADHAVLGVLRFANYPAMVVYDSCAAARVMAAFSVRFEAAAGKRPIAQIDADSFAIWFADAERAPAEAELRSIGYVLAQELSDGELVVAPDVQAGISSLSETDNFQSLVSRAQSSLTPLKRLALAAGADPPDSAADDPAERFAIEQALRRAVRNGELSLRYQPLVDLAAGRLAGAEALLRWSHPTLGDVPPSKFVPLLEQTGLIHDIGLWTLNSGCRQLRQWQAAGQTEIRLAINLSAIQLQNPSLKAVIARTVASHGLKPEDIELELTETAALEDRARTMQLFQVLRELGFGIAIDDFGNGHSNLGYLKDLPFTKLKIDREFVTHVDTRTGSQAICKALIELCNGLGIAVLAEGVERHAEVRTLRAMGCHTFQGYFFARPLTAEEFTAALQDPKALANLAAERDPAGNEPERRIHA